MAYIAMIEEAAATAGQLALTYIEKEPHNPEVAGALARSASRFAVRAIYWKSEQYKRDEMEALHQEGTGLNLGMPRTRNEWDRRAWDFLNQP